MDDLSNLDWSAASQAPKSNATAPVYNNTTPVFRASPAPSLLGNNNNTSRPSSKPPAKAPSPASDSFAGLLSLNSNKTPANLSIQDRQKQLLQEKNRQEQEQRQRYAQQYGAGDQTFWDSLGSQKTAPQPPVQQPNEEEDDILAAFNSSAPVDRSSHFPPPAPSAAASGRNTPANPTNGSLPVDEDDDPFGLGALPQRNVASSQPNTTSVADDDDDILGDLGKPVSAMPPRRETVDDAFALDDRPTPPPSDPLDRPTAELVDMGFPADRSRLALKETGGDIQSAVGWLLNQAHQESRERSQARGSARASPAPQPHDNPRRGREAPDSAMPAWMRQESRPSSAQRRQDNNSPASERDVAAYASEFGTSFLKSANSLWKTGQKKVQKAVAEFQTEGDPNTPKWMRDASADRAPAPRPHQPASQPPAQVANMTDEAMLLESGGQRPQPRKTHTPDIRDPISSKPQSRVSSPAQDLPMRTHPQQRFPQQAPLPDKRPLTKLSRQEVEEQSSQAYVSPSRRKRPAKPEPQPEPEVDLFSPAPVQPVPQPPSGKTMLAPKPSAPKAVAPAPQPTRPQPPRRNIPPVSPSAVSTSGTHRRAGTEAFKRGDFDAAHNSYSAALTPLPSTHPLIIVVLSNRALTAIKTGDPKAAVADADRALEVIGVAKGEGEKIDLGGGEGQKDMKDFYGKALMRKAEALEHMEKWSDAATIWKEAVSAGVGGSVSLRARDRCERAAGGGGGGGVGSGSSASKATPPRPTPVTFKNGATKPPAAKKTVVSVAQSAEAVRKLREANAAADKADDEKFALSDQVEGKVTAWKGGKADNLRALLGSLDNVLWSEAGWKKVGMSDLIMPNKVKIIYMKAIAKVHPDKIPQGATTEQRMISGAVFSTLNEAWDKFKKDNGL